MKHWAIKKSVKKKVGIRNDYCILASTLKVHASEMQVSFYSGIINLHDKSALSD